jgi:prepilin signal peptidase PulO-like enzyme (type II secretory pathway)
MVVFISFGLLCLLTAILAWIDIRYGIIPDWLNLTIAGLGLSKALIVGGPMAGLEAACEGAAIGAIFWLLRRLYFAFRQNPGPGFGRCQIPRGRRNLERHCGPSHAHAGGGADRPGLRRSHAIGRTAIDRSIVHVVRAISGDWPVVHVGSSTIRVMLLSDVSWQKKLAAGPLRSRL